MTTFANAINSNIGANISGVTNTLTITNPSNTASSAANCLCTVGGGTASDPTYQSVISGVTSWTWGCDNSDSDTWCLAASTALGTTNVMHSTTAGEINYPLQPCFLAYVSPTTTNQSGDGTVVTVVYNNEVFDQNADFDSTTGIFTSPVTGRYLLTNCTNLLNLNVAHNDYLFQLNCSNRNMRSIQLNPGPVLNSSNLSLNFTSCTYMDMDAADTAATVWAVNGSTKTVGLSGSTTILLNSFSGSLIV